MRQAGILAAAGLYALENNIERLHEDHKRAQDLANAINEIDTFSVDLDTVQSNMVYISCKDGEAEKVVKSLAKEGVDLLTINESIVRAVIHLHITDEDIERTISAFQSMSN
jgi:threonine aldolase